MSVRLPRCIPRVQAPLLGVAAARSGTLRRLSLSVHAAKGFGKPKPTPTNAADDEGAPRGRKGKAKRVQLQPGSMGPIPNQQRQQLGQDMGQAPFQTKLLSPDQSSEEEEEFMARLRALKAQGNERAAEAAASADGSGDAAAAVAVTPAIFDAAPPTGDDGIYANPPSLSQTLLAAAGGGAAASDISDPKLRDANIGPSQLGLAAGAIVFIAIFVLVAAGDYAPSSRRYQGIKPAQLPPDPIEEKILMGKVSLYEEQIRADPNNDDAAEALATTYARLLQYDKAASLLEKLSKRNPTDAEIWRLFGESSLLSQQPRKAVPAFERAVELRRQQQQQVGPAATITQPDLQLLTGLVDAYIANNDYSKAIDALREVREQLRSKKIEQVVVQPAAAVVVAQPAAPEVRQERDVALPEASGSGREASAGVEAEEALATEAAASTEASVAAAAAAAEPEMLSAPPLTGEDATSATTTATVTTDAAAGTSPSVQTLQPTAPTSADAADARASSSPAAPSAAMRPLDPVGVELLTAKVYSVWRGHDQDALATYDELIKFFPEDYRGYLAKGVFLKEKGRKADAERMFLQARFFAPASKQQLLRAIAESTPAAPQLPDNN